MSRLRVAAAFGHLLPPDLAPSLSSSNNNNNTALDEEETERAAESWILSGGAWKKQPPRAVSPGPSQSSTTTRSVSSSSASRRRRATSRTPPPLREGVSTSSTTGAKPTAPPRAISPGPSLAISQSSTSRSVSSSSASRRRRAKSRTPPREDRSVRTTASTTGSTRSRSTSTSSRASRPRVLVVDGQGLLQQAAAPASTPSLAASSRDTPVKLREDADDAAWVIAPGDWLAAKGDATVSSVDATAASQMSAAAEPTPAVPLSVRARQLRNERSRSNPRTRTRRTASPATTRALPEATGLPRAHVTAIRHCFGQSCNIYKNVLQVGRTANERQLRIAYFRRGRNVLAEHPDAGGATNSNGQLDKKLLKTLSAEVKERFQAVSLAYELLNNKEWKALYDAHGWEAPLVDGPPMSRSVTPPRRSTPPILRPAVGTPDERRSRSAGRGIRWSNQVEELVFRPDPEELQARRLRESPPPDAAPQAIVPLSDLFGPDHEIPEEWEGGNKETSFMANFLGKVDQSLDGLEASLDTWMSSSGGLSMEEWQKQQASKRGRLPVHPDEPGTPQTDNRKRRVESAERMLVTVATENGNPMPPADPAVKQLFSVLDQTTDDRHQREEQHDRSSPSDVRKLTMPADLAFSGSTKEYVNLFPKQPVEHDAFDPFAEPSFLDIDIGDDDFGGSSDFGKEPDNKEEMQFVPVTPPTVDTPTAVAPKPAVERVQESVGSTASIQPPAVPNKELSFSDEVRTLDDESNTTRTSHKGTIDPAKLKRTASEFSSLSGTRSTGYTAYTVETARSESPWDDAVTGMESIREKKMEMEHPETNTPPPCDTEFLNHFFCYTQALSEDITKFSNQLSEQISWEETNKALAATQAMIVESLTFTDENVQGVMSAMDMSQPIARSNTL
jgi:curved DNA-binding protein CbpA